MFRRSCFLAIAAGLCVGAQTPSWVVESNKNAKLLLDVGARFGPEGAGATGVEGMDERIFELKPNRLETMRTAYRTAGKELQARLAKEKDPLVRQDLEILIAQVDETLRGFDIEEKYFLPYFNVTQAVYGGLRGLLDDQIAAPRRPSALARLRRYAGMEEGYTPIATQAEQYIRSRFGKPGLLGPSKAQVEQDLARVNYLIEGIGQLFDKYKLDTYQPAYAKLKEQLAAYNEFVRKEILPKSREDFRLPAEVYAFQLITYGVDLPPAELAAIARAAFGDIRKEMEQLAPKVAKEKGFAAADYRAVIRELKKKQFEGEAILPHYQDRIKQIQEIIRRENLVTLPERPARMRLATPAESAVQPAPHMRPPRLVGNTGESGEFVLPLNVPTAPGTKQLKYDDFTFEAASWTLTCHEARPGHEMQFSAMVERGVSTARAVFAFNSTNVEGWGLYSEWMMKPFMPVEGQLISLQHRLMRAARAFIDPELHMGKMTPAEARRILSEDVVLSDAMVTQETERYMFRAPGQATSYFNGYRQLLAIRQDAEKRMGDRFNQKAFHDFVLGQGLLPPALLRNAVMTGFAKVGG